MFNLSKSKNVSLDRIYRGAKDLYNEIPQVKKKNKRKRILNFLKILVIVLIIIILFFVIVFAVHFANAMIVINQTKQAKKNLEYSLALLDNREYREAILEATKANSSFSLVKNKLEEYEDNYFVNKNYYLNTQLKNSISICASAEIFTRTIEKLAKFSSDLFGINNYKEINFDTLTDEQRKEIFQFVFESAPELNGAKANLNLAVLNLENIDINQLPEFLKNDYEKFSRILYQTEAFFNQLVPSLELLPALSGSPDETNFLFILQNNEEIKAPANQIEAYGILTIKNGKIINFETRSAEILDRAVRDKFWALTPKQIKSNFDINRWYLSDANLSSDFPTAAEKIIWFFEKENQISSDTIDSEEIDGVIIITPEFIGSLLKYLGSVDGVDANNYISILAEKEEKIGELIQKIETEIYSLPLSDLMSILNIVQDNLYKKDIIFYLRDELDQGLLKKQGWAGEIKDNVGDYLMISDFALAKEDNRSQISKNITYSVGQSLNGLFADISIRYSNNYIGESEAPYKVYSRIYVPLGSELRKTQGIKIEEVKKYEEFGKTVYGVLLEIEPGEINYFSLGYKLPESINTWLESGIYNLMIQKQPGSNINNLTVDFDPQNRIKSYEPTGFYVTTDKDKIKWETSLDMDKKFQVFVE